MVSYNMYLKFSGFMVLLTFLDSGCPWFFLVNQSTDLNGVSPSCSPASPGGSLRWMVLMCFCRTHGRPQGDWDLCRFGKIPGVSGLLGSGLQPPAMFFFLGGTCFPKNIKVGLKLEVTNLLGDKFGQLYDDTIFNKGHGWHFGKNNYPGWLSHLEIPTWSPENWMRLGHEYMHACIDSIDR